MISGKNLSCWAVILTFLIGAANSSAQSRSETLFWADPRRDNIWRENARESLPNEEEINQINQKVASLVDEFGDSQYIVREKAVKKFAVWFIDAATTFTAREIIKQELSKIAKNEELELDARYRSAALLKIFPHIERGEEYGIEINSCELPGGEIIITEDLENYCRLIDNFERLLNNPDSVDFPCLVKNGNRIFPFLLKILENPSSFTYPQYLARHIAIRILGKLGGAVSVETLAKILNNDKEPVFFKYEAAKYLAEIGSLQKEGSEIAIDELITVLKKLKSDWWYLSLAGESDKFLKPLLTFARKNKIKVAFNPSGHHIKHKKKEILFSLKDLAFLVLNTGEAADLVDIPFKREKDVFKKLDKLTPGIVAVTDGSNGVIVSDGKFLYKAGIFKEQAVVDRTGAGDSFGSGFVAGLMRRSRMSKAWGQMFSPEDIKYAIRLATANATSVVEKIGATEGVLTKEKFEKDKRWKNLDIKVVNI